MKLDSSEISQAFNSASGINGNLVGMLAITFLILICVFFLGSAIIALVDTYRNRKDVPSTFLSFMWVLVGLIFVIAFFAYLSTNM